MELLVSFSNYRDFIINSIIYSFAFYNVSNISSLLILIYGALYIYRLYPLILSLIYSKVEPIAFKPDPTPEIVWPPILTN